MLKLSAARMGAIAFAMLAIAAAGRADAAATVSRSELCSRLSQQVDEAVQSHAKAAQVASARALQRKANRYCAKQKQAQGIRMLANALRLLGVKPVVP